MDSSPDRPIPVRTASRLLGAWIHRTGEIWVEGELTQVRRRGGTTYLRLRDTDTDMSIPVRTATRTLSTGGGPVEDGHRVVVRIRARYDVRRGEVQWQASHVRPVGVGALLARIEALKKTLAAEGLFAAERKRRLPFLPDRIGLIVGRRSAAEKDVVVNATDRWPAVRFRTEEVPVQGPKAVPQVIAALERLSGTDVDVVVIARGGGSAEDLLPFSNETLVRAAAAMPVPVVSAIGHEEDSPILDLVADFRASTPTDAGRSIVPDRAAELEALHSARRSTRSSLSRLVEGEAARIDDLSSRPVLSDAGEVVRAHRRHVDELVGRIGTAVRGGLDRAGTERVNLRHRLRRSSPSSHVAREHAALPGTLRALRWSLRARLESESRAIRASGSQLTSLSPQGTLDRGYAVVRLGSTVVRDPAQAPPGSDLRVRVARGEFAARREGEP